MLSYTIEEEDVEKYLYSTEHPQASIEYLEMNQCSGISSFV